MCLSWENFVLTHFSISLLLCWCMLMPSMAKLFSLSLISPLEKKFISCHKMNILTHLKNIYISHVSFALYPSFILYACVNWTEVTMQTSYGMSLAKWCAFVSLHSHYFHFPFLLRFVFGFYTCQFVQFVLNRFYFQLFLFLSKFYALTFKLDVICCFEMNSFRSLFFFLLFRQSFCSIVFTK